MTLYRVSHDIQKLKPKHQALVRLMIKKPWRYAVPEIYHFDQERPTVLTEAWQWFIFHLNPGMTGAGWRNLFWDNLAFSNGTGYDGPDGVIRQDFINRKGLDGKPLIMDKVRCFSGYIRGEKKGNRVYVETLDGSKPPPDVDPVEDRRRRPWLYTMAQIVLRNGSTIGFPQNSPKYGAKKTSQVWVPIVSTGGIVTARYDENIIDKPYPWIREVKQ